MGAKRWGVFRSFQRLSSLPLLYPVPCESLGTAPFRHKTGARRIGGRGAAWESHRWLRHLPGGMLTAKESRAAKARSDSHRERANPGIAASDDTTRNPATTKTDGVGFEVVSVSPRRSSHLRHGLREGEAKGEAVCPPAVFAGGVAAAPADQAERLGSLTKADAIPPEVAELAAVWHRLPAAVRAGVVAMVRASGG